LLLLFTISVQDLKNAFRDSLLRNYFTACVMNTNSERLEGICRIDSRTTILSYGTKGVRVEGKLYTYGVAPHGHGTGLAWA
jgi:hypothetical protein